MKVTFIVVSYNEKEYLPEAIESCIKQNLNDYEIIIGDDGSDDGSVELIEEYTQKYPEQIRYFVSDRSDVVPGELVASIRVSNVIKRALEMARGEYCICISGDDYFYPGIFIKKAVSFLDKHREYAACVGRYNKVWSDGAVEHCGNYCFPSKLGCGQYIHISAYIFRKSAVEKEGLLRLCDDTGFTYILALAGKWKCVEDVVFAYRQRDGSIMHKADKMNLWLTELLLLQDMLGKGKLKRQVLSKYPKPLYGVFLNRKKIATKEYRKYLKYSGQYDYDVIRYIMEFDQKKNAEKRKFILWMGYTFILGGLYRTFYQVSSSIHNAKCHKT